LIFTCEAATGRMRLMRYKLAERTADLFHRKEDMSDRELTVSADGSVYTYNLVNGLGTRIIVQDTKGGKQIAVPYSGVADWAHWPAMAPDGNRVVFSEGAGPLMAYDFKKNAGKDSLERLTVKGATYSDLMPRFAPDGRQIVFISRRDDDMEVYVMNPDGSGQKRLTNSPGIDCHPVFSPDGKQIAFTSNRDGKYEIYVMNADGSNVRRITKHAEHNNHPGWHPDGKHLVFVGERKGRHDLYQCSLS
jgi:Tol biopolymer transport system component